MNTRNRGIPRRKFRKYVLSLRSPLRWKLRPMVAPSVDMASRLTPKISSQLRSRRKYLSFTRTTLLSGYSTFLSRISPLLGSRRKTRGRVFFRNITIFRPMMRHAVFGIRLIIGRRPYRRFLAYLSANWEKRNLKTQVSALKPPLDIEVPPVRNRHSRRKFAICSRHDMHPSDWSYGSWQNHPRKGPRL